jgi:hypothetical protein
MNAVNKTTLVNPNNIQPTEPADKWQDKLNLPKGAEITPYQALRSNIEMRKTNVAGIYGFRIRCISDETGDTRLIQAATKYADDYALGVAGVRGEMLGLGIAGDYTSSPGGYTQTRLDALKRMREAIQGLGMRHSNMLHMVLIECVSARELGRRFGIDDKTAAKRAITSLNALADWYEKPRSAKSANS